MGKIFVSLYNSKVCTHEHEWLERVEDAPWDRWMQLGLLAKVRLIDNEHDVGDFLSADVRAKIISLLSDHLADGYADDNRRSIKESFEDMLRHGSRSYEESTDYELYQEFLDYEENYNPEVDENEWVTVGKEARAQRAIAETLR